MKKLLSIVALSFLITPLEAATVTNYITDGFGNPINTRVIFTPFIQSTVFGSTNILGPSVSLTTTNGAWSQTVLGGWYYVNQGLGQSVITIWANPGDTQTNSFAYFAAAATNPIPSFFASGAGVMFVTNVVTTNTYQNQQNRWVKYRGTNALYIGAIITPSLVTEDAGVGEPSVLYDGGRFRMWYTAGQDGNHGERIHYAESPDGTNWTKWGPVLGNGYGGLTVDADLSMMYLESGVYYLYHATNHFNSPWFVSVSPDGTNFNGQTMLMNVPSTGNSCVWKSGTNYYALVENQIGGVWKIGTAWSTNATNGWLFTMNPNPSLDPGLGSYSAGNVQTVNGVFWAWIHAQPPFTLPSYIYSAYSTDGTNWNQYSGATPVVSITWETVAGFQLITNLPFAQVADPDVHQVGTNSYMFYSSDKNWSGEQSAICLATAAMPLATLVSGGATNIGAPLVNAGFGNVLLPSGIVVNNSSVGIGNTAPVAPLDIGDSRANRGFIVLRDDGTYCPIIYMADSRTNGKIWLIVDGQYTNGTFSILDAVNGNFALNIYGDDTIGTRGHIIQPQNYAAITLDPVIAQSDRMFIGNKYATNAVEIDGGIVGIATSGASIALFGTNYVSPSGPPLAGQTFFQSPSNVVFAIPAGNAVLTLSNNFISANYPIGVPTANVTNLIALSTNYVAANFTPRLGQVFLIASNNAIYSVSTTKTNLIAGP